MRIERRYRREKWRSQPNSPTQLGPDAASLLIDEVHVFPANQPNLKLGFREVKSLFQSMVDDLGNVGFETVTIRGAAYQWGKIRYQCSEQNSVHNAYAKTSGQP